MAEHAAPKPKRITKRDFFVSFNKADLTSAQLLRDWLEAAGHTTFMQQPDFHAGSNFVLKMDEGVKTCRRLIAVLSPAYLAAEFPQPEWAAFFAKDPRGELGLVVGVRVTSCEVDGLLGVIRYIDLAEVADAEKRDKFLCEIGELPAVPKTAARRKASPAPSTPPPPSPTPGSMAINVTGNVGHLAGGGMTVNHYHKPPKPKVFIERRDTWISDAQAAQIKVRITDLAQFRVETSNGRLSLGKAFAFTYKDFYDEFEIPRYDALPAECFEDALDWFRQQKGILTRKLRKLDQPAWRNARIGSIKKAMKKMGRENVDFYPEVATRLKMKPFVSLTKVTDRDLQRIYQLALGDAGESEE